MFNLKDRSVLSESNYLDLTYSEERIPFGTYPFQLTEHIHETYFDEPGRLLDLGCGRAEHMRGFAKLGYDVAGIDISESAAQYADPIPVAVCNFERDSLPYPAGSFDYAFSKSVVEHMQYPECLVKKAFEALRPGGRAVIMTPSWEYSYWGPFYIDHTHVSPFTRPSLRDLMMLNGFGEAHSIYFYQLPFLWKYPATKPLVKWIAALPVPYRPFKSAPWPDGLNKLIRFSKEVMLLCVGKKPA